MNKTIVIGGIGEKKSNGGKQWYLQDRVYRGDYVIAIAASFNPYYMIGETMEQLRIRKLTPKECWRLMGFDDEDYERASQECSSSQLYKQAGNSICVQVLENIFKQLL